MRRLSLAIALTAWIAATSGSAEEPPAAADLLFERADWQAAPPDMTLLYRYQRVSGLAPDRIKDFSDTIRLRVAPGASANLRNVQVEMFPDTQRPPAGPFDDTSGNPVLVLFLEQHLRTLGTVLGANPRYLRNAIRTGLRETASVTPVTATYRDEPVPAWRVETQPFANDPHRDQMQGLGSMHYGFVTSDRVPGRVLSIDVKAVSEDGRTLLQETLSYDPSGS